ncbi:MAG: hypothetical protein JKY65_20650 [Planctomycetes bacterium]|nr:hypothetical protein [Planctomycetota bacterium]
MRNRFSWCGLVTLLLLLGCASEPGAAQDRGKGAKEEKAPKGEKAPAKKKKAKGKPKSKKKKMDPRVYRATVHDRFLKKGQKPFKASKIRLFEPEVSLFGGSAGKESKTLLLLRGAATIEVPFARLKKIHVGAVKEDRLAIKVEIEAKDPEDRILEGTVKASLELRCLFAKDFKTTIKLREVKTLTLELDPEAPENKKLKGGGK